EHSHPSRERQSAGCRPMACSPRTPRRGATPARFPSRHLRLAPEPRSTPKWSARHLPSVRCLAILRRRTTPATAARPTRCRQAPAMALGVAAGHARGFRSLPDTLEAHLGQPLLEGLGFLGRDRLDDPEHRLDVGAVGTIALAVRGGELQLVTFCHELMC